MSAGLLRATLFCSDVNERTIISVCPDNVDEGFILVTCSTYVKRYNVMHKIPENSWSTKTWDPFTSGALRCPESKQIFAVTGGFSLCQWEVTQVDMSAVTKNKFKSRIHEICISQNKLFIVFSDGFVQLLSEAVKTRKMKKPLFKDEGEVIVGYRLLKNNSLAAFTLRQKHGTTRLLLNPMAEGEAATPAFINVTHGDLKLVGSTIVSTGRLITFWNDGNLFDLDFTDNSTLHPAVPGVPQEKVTKLNPRKQTSIIELSPNHIALQGMNINEEGGLLVLWDLKYGLPVSTKPLKMYKDPPLSWKVNNAIILIQGGSLCYVPYEIRNSTLASMFGSKVSDRTVPKVKHIESLESKSMESEALHKDPLLEGKSRTMVELFVKLSSDAYSQDIISLYIVKEAIESKNSQLVYECLDTFDIIPERSLLAILKYFLASSEDDVYFMKNILPDINSSTDTDSHQLFSPIKSVIINKILLKPISIKAMSRYLHLLDFSSSVDLITYLHCLLSEEQLRPAHSDATALSLERICLWLSLLLDANYHQLVCTSEVDIHKKLLSCLDDVAMLKMSLETAAEVAPLIERVMESKPLKRHQENTAYSIERILIL